MLDGQAHLRPRLLLSPFSSLNVRCAQTKMYSLARVNKCGESTQGPMEQRAPLLPLVMPSAHSWPLP
eukprot:15444444-Alexandrium_andersonii.AAC.1